MTIEVSIKRQAAALGFDAVGITSTEPLDTVYADYHARWLDAGCAAGMHHLHRNNDKRFTPAKLLEGAKSVICVALNYRPHRDELPAALTLPVARFALYDDYHDFIKMRLNALAEFIQSLFPDRPLRFKACCDAIPLAERILAQRAGLGFIGRNHFLIHPHLGCQILLGELLTTLPLEPDSPLTDDPCAHCRRCVAACPGGALDDNGGFDARRCISCLTQGQGGDEPGLDTAGRLFGCDACMLACPFEKEAPPRSHPDLKFYPQRAQLTVEEVLGWTQADFDSVCKGSCLERLGLSHLQHIARSKRTLA